MRRFYDLRCYPVSNRIIPILGVPTEDAFITGCKFTTINFFPRLSPLYFLLFTSETTRLFYCFSQLQAGVVTTKRPVPNQSLFFHVVLSFIVSSSSSPRQ
ncbi:unnamed protein product [Sympodiomycopsis kandeliae]